MKYLHTMIRIKNVEESLRFFCEGLGLKETRRMEDEKGRYTLIFLFYEFFYFYHKLRGYLY